MRLMSGREKLMQIDLSNRGVRKDNWKIFLLQTGGIFRGKKNSWRYDEEGTGEIKNSTLQTGLYGTSFYFSMANPYVAEYQSSLYWNNTQEQSYRGADKRSALEILGGVKYFVTPKKGKDLVLIRKRKIM